MERLDIKGKFKTFITDSKQKLLSPGSLGSGADGEDWQLILPQVISKFCVLLDVRVAFLVHQLSQLFQGTSSLDRGDWSDSDREVCYPTNYSFIQGDFFNWASPENVSRLAPPKIPQLAPL